MDRKHQVLCSRFFFLQAPEETDASQKPPEPPPVEESPTEPEKAE